MRLYLIRHPQPEVATGICYGRSDLAVPVERAAQAASALAPRLPRDAVLWSSPAARCAALAGLLAGALGTTVRYDARLLEMDFGAWEMQAWDSIPRSEVDAWAAGMTTYRPGGGERVLDVARRVKAFHDGLKTDGRDAVLVCHAGVIRLLLAAPAHDSPAGMAIAAASAPHRIAYGELVIADCATGC
ncbi:histidine phosphatase family protein [Noviherbaspirillum soli]|uniref:histidine phosphatase family protein n=1 Tax=Noviherbaspirillum soli TaxID=1064518 RepID=UPI001889E91B|nr:histidine phosphatase family protein [Noviherbaspirillum soli]